MRRPVAVCAGLCAVSVLALVIAGLARHTRLAFTLGVPAAIPTATLQPGQEACQTPISVPPGGDYDRVVLKLGTFGQPGSGVAVQVRRLGSGRVLGEGTIPAGYPDIARQPEHRVNVGAIPAGSQTEVCVVNRGDRRVAIYGNADAASRTSTETFEGKPTGTDMTLSFERSPRSLLSLVP